MDLATAVAALEAGGTEQNRKVYRRHGARDPLFGVSFAILDKLAKQAKRDQALADGLWATGNYDCRILACKVADPAAVDDAKLDAWLAEIDVYVLVDVFTWLAGVGGARRPGAGRALVGVGPGLDRRRGLEPLRVPRAQRRRPATTPGSWPCWSASSATSHAPATGHGMR